MERNGRRWVVGLVALAGALAAIASGAGVLLRGDLATMPFVTVRGEHVDVLTNGIYRFNGKAVAAEGVGWDAVTLFLVVPTLAVLLPGLLRGALPARLAATGILAYFLYQYFEYATFLAYGPLFGVYVAIVALSLTGIVNFWSVRSRLAGSAIASRLDSRAAAWWPSGCSWPCCSLACGCR